MTHLSLFSGIGGLDLAAEWAGFETVGQCEWADYPTKVLEKHWPDVQRWRDIRTLTAEDFYARTGKRTVDVISGGFPCQPFSVAGKQKGKGDGRYLWPEMLRVIRELKPRWVLGENVPGILRIAAADVVTDLEREGFDVVVFDFEAAAVGAPHRRERIAFAANSRSGGHKRKRDLRDLRSVQGRDNKQRETNKPFQSGKVSADVADADQQGLSGYQFDGTPDEECAGETESREATAKRRDALALSDTHNGSRTLQRNWELSTARAPEGRGHYHGGRAPEHGTRQRWLTEPNVGRVANGVPHRVDRLKCLGNAVVPQQFYPIFKAIYDVEARND